MNNKIIAIFLVTIVFFLPFCFSGENNVENAAFDKNAVPESSIAEKMADLVDSALESYNSTGSLQEETETSSCIDDGAIAPAQIAEEFMPPDMRGKKIDLEFDNVSMENVLRTIGESAGINIVLSPSVKEKRATLHLKGIPLEEAVGLLYHAYNLGSYKVGNSLYISTKDEIKKESIVTKVIKLRNLDVEEVRNLIKDLVKTVNISPKTNAIVVVGTPEEIIKVENIIREVDKPQIQVVLEAKIMEIDKDGLKEIGIDWSDSIVSYFQEGKRSSELGVTEISGSSPFKLYRLARSAVQFNAILKMLESKDKAEVLSNPSVTTLNNKESEIFVGDEVPYTVTTISGGASTTEVRFAESGIKLKITPSIIEKDFVVIKIEPEVSYIFGWRGPDDQYPWIKTRKAVAHVRVKNNQPFIMGGLLTSEDKKNLYKVPIMGDVPFLGKLFKYERHTTADSELVIGIIPKIIYGE